MDLSTGEGGSHVAMGKARCAAVTNVKKTNVLPLADLWDSFWSVLKSRIPFAAPRPEGSITEGTCAGTEKLGQLQIGSSMIDASIFSHRWDNGIRHQPSKQVITGRISKTGWIWHICQSKLTLIYCIPCWITEESCSLSSLRATAYRCVCSNMPKGQSFEPATITRMFVVTWNGMEPGTLW